MVGLFETREGEGAWAEEARGGIGGRGRLVRVEGSAVVFGRAELVSIRDQWSRPKQHVACGFFFLDNEILQ